MLVSFRPLNKALDAIFNYQTVTQENLSSGFAVGTVFSGAAVLMCR